jgi:hypothetical protein
VRSARSLTQNSTKGDRAGVYVPQVIDSGLAAVLKRKSFRELAGSDQALPNRFARNYSHF